jgi:hypothetical protein
MADGGMVGNKEKPPMGKRAKTTRALYDKTTNNEQ